MIQKVSIHIVDRHNLLQLGLFLTIAIQIL